MAKTAKGFLIILLLRFGLGQLLVIISQNPAGSSPTLS